MLTVPTTKLSTPVIADVAQYFEIVTNGDLTFSITILFIIAILLANILRLLLLWSITKLSFMTGADLSFEVYRRTLYQPYIVHLDRNSSEIISGVLGKVAGVVYGALLPVLNFISAFLLLTTVITTLMVIEPILTSITVFVFGLIYVVITLSLITPRNQRAGLSWIQRF